VVYEGRTQFVSAAMFIGDTTELLVLQAGIVGTIIIPSSVEAWTKKSGLTVWSLNERHCLCSRVGPAKQGVCTDALEALVRVPSIR